MMRLTIALLTLALSYSTTMATTVIANGWVWKESADETDDHIGGSPDSSNNPNLRGLHSSASEPQQEATQPQHVPQKSTDNKQLQETFLQNMLTNQGCPPTSSCGDVCYVLTVAAASDLHSVAVGTTNRPSHHWHEPSSFWRAGICNAKAQCVSVNPFDKSHTFNDLASTLANVERECERSVGMASMFLLAKAMDPTTRSCDHGHSVSYPNALV
eukprot:scaffold11910_cov104-Skeletonema_dohrnii-CCMP3373.AAC.3